MSYIYFDQAASTKPLKEVLEVFNQISTDYYANPSALHIAGLEAERILRASAETISKLLHINSEEIYFTSGGTESNNLAINGMVKARVRTHCHIITLQSEHPSVTEVYKKLESEGFSVTWLNGLISPEEVYASLREDTALVSIAHVNNETGHIYDIETIAKKVKALSSAYFFADGVQGFGKLPVSLKYVDGYSFSGHKIGCIKGVGGLYLSSNCRIIPQILGGGQQRNIRSGTENTASVAALSKGAEIAFGAIEENQKKVSAVKNELLNLQNQLDDVHINGGSSPYILNMSFLGVKSEVLLHSLAEAGVLASAGSACSSSKKDKEKNALYAMGYDKSIYESAIRFSFSPQNTVDEAKRAAEIIYEKVNFLRKYTRK
ncbi:MAG: cysteine desulfurase [Defluviitaleaceae bacterium]|nr:cysteine desulfurase [Defluviitaleaceae bacterium]